MARSHQTLSKSSRTSGDQDAKNPNSEASVVIVTCGLAQRSLEALLVLLLGRGAAVAIGVQQVVVVLQACLRRAADIAQTLSRSWTVFVSSGIRLLPHLIVLARDEALACNASRPCWEMAAQTDMK